MILSVKVVEAYPELRLGSSPRTLIVYTFAFVLAIGNPLNVRVVGSKLSQEEAEGEFEESE